MQRIINLVFDFIHIKFSKKLINININDKDKENICELYNTYPTKQWNKYYELVKEYYIENNSLDILYNYKKEDINLGKWLIYQRQLYKNKLLSKEQINKLEKIGISWIPKDDTWNYNYELAKQYYKKFGDCNIPNTYKVNNTNLGNWLSTQRKKYKNNTLTQEQIDKLESINISWEPFKDIWEHNYTLAKKYYSIHKNLIVSEEYIIDNLNLSQWLTAQRKAYKNNKLTQEQINKLEAINICWDIDEYKWNENYKLAKEYYETYNNLLIPSCYKVQDIKLGAWILYERQAYKNKSLSEEKIKKLESIGMIWENTLNYNWNKKYELAKKYYEKHNNSNITFDYKVNNTNLGKW